MTHPIDPWQHVHASTLADYQQRGIAEPFSDLLWLLNETEHGSASPERLHGFAQLIAHPERTPEIDQEFLVPYLLRYMWEVPYAPYTRQAWICLETLIDDAERLRDVAEAILALHPHGDTRAAVVQCRADSCWPQYLCDALFMQRLAQLMHNDAHPAVRSACIEFLALHSEIGTPDQRQLQVVLVALLAKDPSDEVRAAAFQALADWENSASEIHAALTQALRDTRNVRVLPQMLNAVSSSWLGSTNLSAAQPCWMRWPRNARILCSKIYAAAWLGYWLQVMSLTARS